VIQLDDALEEQQAGEIERVCARQTLEVARRVRLDPQLPRRRQIQAIELRTRCPQSLEDRQRCLGMVGIDLLFEQAVGEA
jgi:hypothetical protein